MVSTVGYGHFLTPCASTYATRDVRGSAVAALPCPCRRTLKLNKKPTCRGFLGTSWLQVFGTNTEERLLTSSKNVGIWEFPGKIVSV